MIKARGNIENALAELTSDDNNAVAHVFANPQFGSGPLAGATVTVKDLFATGDVKTQGSSKILENFKPAYDATIIRRIRANGGAIVAKVHSDELGLGGTGTFSAFGPIQNRRDKNRIIGGSSSGSVATLTKNISLAVASDTGDSVRLPASYNGFVGFKPSYGAISRYGLYPYGSSLDTVGVLSHNVHDAIQGARALFGKDPCDLTSKDIAKPAQNLVKPRTVAVLKDELNVLDDLVKTKFMNFLRQLKADGVKITEVTIDINLLRAIETVYAIISYSEALSNSSNLTGIPFGQRKNGANPRAISTNSRSIGFGKMVQRRFTLGSFFLATENQTEIFVRAQKVRSLITNAFNTVFARCDFLLFPSTTIAPLKTAPKLATWFDSYLASANLTGGPSIALPFARIGQMPFGINLDARLYNDKKLLSHALYIEQMISKGGFDD